MIWVLCGLIQVILILNWPFSIPTPNFPILPISWERNHTPDYQDVPLFDGYSSSGRGKSKCGRESVKSLHDLRRCCSGLLHPLVGTSVVFDLLGNGQPLLLTLLGYYPINQSVLMMLLCLEKYTWINYLIQFNQSRPTPSKVCFQSSPNPIPHPNGI